MLSPQVLSHLARFTMPPIISSKVMSFEDQKMFEKFTHLGPASFSGGVGEDVYELLIACCKKFQNLGFLESHRVSHMTNCRGHLFV